MSGWELGETRVEAKDQTLEDIDSTRVKKVVVHLENVQNRKGCLFQRLSSPKDTRVNIHRHT